MRRPTVTLLVIDAVGIPTMEHLLSSCNSSFYLPNLAMMGFGNLLSPQFHVYPRGYPQFAYAIEQASEAADSVIGHREMVGIVDNSKYELFFDGFPEHYVNELEKRIGTVIFNQMSGGLSAIEGNREEHEKTGHPILYASKCDPVLQIAMNEDVIPVKRAHEIADIAFEVAQETNVEITRSIARTYVVRDGEVVRTPNRHDAVLPMEGNTLLDVLYDNGVYTASVGKPAELIPSRKWGRKVKLTRKEDLVNDVRFVHPKGKDNNPYSIQGAINELKRVRSSYRPNGSFLFINCVDTDSLYGHTQDVEGSLKSIAEVDRCIPLILDTMQQRDVLLITADHGMEHRGDYGYHSKEAVPLLGVGKGVNMRRFALKSSKTFCAVGDIVAQALGLSEEFRKTCGIEF